MWKSVESTAMLTFTFADLTICKYMQIIYSKKAKIKNYLSFFTTPQDFASHQAESTSRGVNLFLEHGRF